MISFYFDEDSHTDEAKFICDIIVLVYTKQKMYFIWLDWKGDYSRAPRPLCFANQWISQGIQNLSSQSDKVIFTPGSKAFTYQYDAKLLKAEIDRPKESGVVFSNRHRSAEQSTSQPYD